MNEMIGTTIAALLTLMVFSYLVRDNPLHRVAQHLLVASVAAYAVIAALRWVLWPMLFQPMLSDPTAHPDLLVPFILGMLLLTKALPRYRSIGTLSIAYVVGLGLALAVGGALLGTLIPQGAATMLPVLPTAATPITSALQNAIVVIGTVTTLLSFLYLTRRPTTGSDDSPAGVPPAAPWQRLGRLFLMITLGAIFGGLGLTYMALLVGRLDFLINEWLRPLIGL